MSRSKKDSSGGHPIRFHKESTYARRALNKIRRAKDKALIRIGAYDMLHKHKGTQGWETW